jgi:endonuclease YncB( thermonuclease family)
MAHDFIKFPELTNSQMQLYYFESPHKQITEDFKAEVIKVHDGDTITLRTSFRDFDFPLRLANINAPELNEPEGRVSKDWLKDKIEGKSIEVQINKSKRVGKYGRLIGIVFSEGQNVNEEALRMRFATEFGMVEFIPDFASKELRLSRWV